MKAPLLHLKTLSDLIHRFHLIRTVLKGYLQTNKLMFLPVGPRAQFSLLTFLLKCLCASLEGVPWKILGTDGIIVFSKLFDTLHGI